MTDDQREVHGWLDAVFSDPEWLADYTDSGGEYRCTKLAEDAAQEFDLYGADADATIPEWVYEMTAEAAREHSRLLSTREFDERAHYHCVL